MADENREAGKPIEGNQPAQAPSSKPEADPPPPFEETVSEPSPEAVKETETETAPEPEDSGETISDWDSEPPAETAFDPDNDPLIDRIREDAPVDEADYYDEPSQFDFVPPFRARRNPLKMWTIAAAAFALLATGTVFAASYYGLPDWFPLQRPTFGVGQPDLTLDFPKDQQRTEVLETGEKIFRVRGSITNTSRETVSVPTMLVVFRDERDRNVGDWPIVPAKRELAPGESLNVTEAIADIPPAARDAEIGWAPN